MKIQTEFSFFDEQGFGGESPQHAGNTLVRRSQAGVLPLLAIFDHEKPMSYVGQNSTVFGPE